MKTVSVVNNEHTNQKQILDVKKNRLQDCPEAIGSLSRLKRLELDGEKSIPSIKRDHHRGWLIVMQEYREKTEKSRSTHHYLLGSLSF